MYRPRRDFYNSIRLVVDEKTAWDMYLKQIDYETGPANTFIFTPVCTGDWALFRAELKDSNSRWDETLGHEIAHYADSFVVRPAETANRLKDFLPKTCGHSCIATVGRLTPVSDPMFITVVFVPPAGLIAKTMREHQTGLNLLAGALATRLPALKTADALHGPGTRFRYPDWPENCFG